MSTTTSGGTPACSKCACVYTLSSKTTKFVEGQRKSSFPAPTQSAWTETTIHSPHCSVQYRVPPAESLQLPIALVWWHRIVCSNTQDTTAVLVLHQKPSLYIHCPVWIWKYNVDTHVPVHIERITPGKKLLHVGSCMTMHKMRNKASHMYIHNSQTQCCQRFPYYYPKNSKTIKKSKVNVLTCVQAYTSHEEALAPRGQGIAGHSFSHAKTEFAKTARTMACHAYKA